MLLLLGSDRAVCSSIPSRNIAQRIPTQQHHWSSPKRLGIAPSSCACVGNREFGSGLGEKGIPRNIVAQVAAMMLSLIFETLGLKPKCHSHTLNNIASASSARDICTFTAS